MASALLPRHATVRILTSWKESNLLQRSSSLELYPLCKERGWDLYTLNNLHAKIYAFHPSHCWIGSANFTRSGLHEHGNLEVLTQHDRDDQTNAEIESLFIQSRLVDDALFDAYKQWFSEQKIPPAPTFDPFEEPVLQMPFSLDSLPQTLSPTMIIEALSGGEDTSEAKRSIAHHDLSLLGVNFIEDTTLLIDRLRARYFSIPLVRHLLGLLDGQWTRFGRMRSQMSEACGGYGAVGREEVTFHTQNLYQWVEELDVSGNFEFGTPRHSQLIRRAEK